MEKVSGSESENTSMDHACVLTVRPDPWMGLSWWQSSHTVTCTEIGIGTLASEKSGEDWKAVFDIVEVEEQEKEAPGDFKSSNVYLKYVCAGRCLSVSSFDWFPTYLRVLS